MKIGVITFHKVNNIGGALQASALLKFINRMNINCEIIDFVPNDVANERRNIISTSILKCKRMLKFAANKELYQRIKKFSKFQKQHYILSTKTYYGDSDIHQNPPKYDLLISGSDQILNTTLTGNSTSYYLDFCNDTPKMSYASSFGRDHLTGDEYELISNELSKFEFLSVREASAGEIIARTIGRNPELVMDPVFLLDSHAWANLAKTKNMAPFDKYIFVYSMEQSSSLEKAIIELKEKTGLHVIVVKGGGTIGPVYDFEDKTCGPAEFLRYILDAEYVVTNSFHGTAMSLIFGKKFISVSHSSRNARLQNIMNLVSSENNLLPFDNYIGDILDDVNDGTQLYALLANHIHHSKQYLQSAIEHYKK